MELPSNLEALARLIGSWSGPGEGAYPTSRSFSYQETITFTCNGQTTPGQQSLENGVADLRCERNVDLGFY